MASVIPQNREFSMHWIVLTSDTYFVFLTISIENAIFFQCFIQKIFSIYKDKQISFSSDIDKTILFSSESVHYVFVCRFACDSRTDDTPAWPIDFMLDTFISRGQNTWEQYVGRNYLFWLPVS